MDEKVVSTEATTEVVAEPKKDEFGRDAAERTVELLPVDAEAINKEVEDGDHETFAGALSYVILCGLREIKRTRQNQQKAAEGRALRQQKELYKAMVAANPKLLEDADFSKKFTTLMLSL